MGSALEHPEVVRDCLAKECAGGSVPSPVFPGIQVSRFGVIPKGKTGKWWLILDLSSPEGASVNDGIDPVVCSLSYVSVDDMARAVVEAGRGAFLAKVTSSRLTGWYRCTWRIGSCWGWYGRTVCLSTQHSLLAYAPPPKYLIPWRMLLVADQTGGGGSVLHYLDDFLLVAECQESCQEAL